jgi:hypothetical protein
MKYLIGIISLPVGLIGFLYEEITRSFYAGREMWKVIFER